jgi:hypothetical protein
VFTAGNCRSLLGFERARGIEVGIEHDIDTDVSLAVAAEERVHVFASEFDGDFIGDVRRLGQYRPLPDCRTHSVEPRNRAICSDFRQSG